MYVLGQVLLPHQVQLRAAGRAVFPRSLHDREDPVSLSGGIYNGWLSSQALAIFRLCPLCLPTPAALVVVLELEKPTDVLSPS